MLTHLNTLWSVTRKNTDLHMCAPAFVWHANCVQTKPAYTASTHARAQRSN